MLDISMEFKKGILFVRLKGVINGDTSKILENNIIKTIKNNQIKYLLINFEKTKYIDQYGIHTISKIYHLIKLLQGKFIVCGIKTLINLSTQPLEYLYHVDVEEKSYEVIKL